MAIVQEQSQFHLFLPSFSLSFLCSFPSIPSFFLNLFMIVTERERETETQAEGEAGSMHREPDVGFDPGSPGSRPGPKAGAKLLHHPGIPLPPFLNSRKPSRSIHVMANGRIPFFFMIEYMCHIYVPHFLYLFIH